MFKSDKIKVKSNQNVLKTFESEQIVLKCFENVWTGANLCWNVMKRSESVKTVRNENRHFKKRFAKDISGSWRMLSCVVKSVSPITAVIKFWGSIAEQSISTPPAAKSRLEIDVEPMSSQGTTYVYVNAHLYIWIETIYVYIHMYVCVGMCIFRYRSACVHVDIQTYTYIHLCMHICVWLVDWMINWSIDQLLRSITVYTYIYVHVYMYMNIYTYMHMFV